MSHSDSGHDSDDSDGFNARIRQRNDMYKKSAQPSNPLDMKPVGASQPHNRIPNTPAAVALISFVLGGVCVFACTVFASASLRARLGLGGLGLWFATPQLSFFVAAWSIFHWAEFAVTAGWNREKCSVDSFLLDNGAMYHIAHGTALAEYILSSYFVPSWKSFPYVTAVGMFLVVIGQALRSASMIHAATNFSHGLAFKKADTHQLVQDGVYAWFRHPSYAGFYYWALGTQLVLQNLISFVLYSILLWKFFYYRTRAEEAALVRFFGDEYVQYSKRVGTKIPFVP